MISSLVFLAAAGQADSSLELPPVTPVSAQRETSWRTLDLGPASKAPTLSSTAAVQALGREVELTAGPGFDSVSATKAADGSVWVVRRAKTSEAHSLWINGSETMVQGRISLYLGADKYLGVDRGEGFQVSREGRRLLGPGTPVAWLSEGWIALDRRKPGAIELRLVGPQGSWVFPEHRLLGEGPVGTIVLARRDLAVGTPVREEILWIRRGKAALRVEPPSGWGGLAVTRQGEVILARRDGVALEFALLSGSSLRPLRVTLPLSTGKILSAAPSLGGGGLDLKVEDGDKARLLRISP